MAKYIVDSATKKISEDKNYSKKVIKKTKEIGIDLYKECYKVFDNLDKLEINNPFFAKTWQKIIKLFFEIHGIGFGVIASDLQHHHFSNLLEKIIKGKIKKYKLEKSLGDYVGILTKSPLPTKKFLANKNLLEICNKIEKVEIKKEFSKMPTDKLVKFLKNNQPEILKLLSSFIF
ncbi:MAG: hypothetical protein AB1465_04245 [Patescibacteria group bacterium]